MDADENSMNDPIGNENLLQKFERRMAVILSQEAMSEPYLSAFYNSVCHYAPMQSVVICGADSQDELALCHKLLTMRIPLVMVRAGDLMMQWQTEVLVAAAEQRIFLVSIRSEVCDWSDEDALLTYRDQFILSNSTCAIVSSTTLREHALVEKRVEKSVFPVMWV